MIAGILVDVVKGELLPELPEGPALGQRAPVTGAATDEDQVHEPVAMVGHLLGDAFERVAAEDGDGLASVGRQAHALRVAAQQPGRLAAELRMHQRAQQTIAKLIDAHASPIGSTTFTGLLTHSCEPG